MPKFTVRATFTAYNKAVLEIEAKNPAEAQKILESLESNEDNIKGVTQHGKKLNSASDVEYDNCDENTDFKIVD